MTDRTAFHTDESFQAIDGKFILVEIQENKAGYWPREQYNTLAEAVSAAKEKNISNDLSEDDVREIRISSMRLQLEEQEAKEGY